MIYLDHASTTYVSPEIIDVINSTMKESWGNPSNLYDWGVKSKKIINEARISIAGSIGAKPGEIYFTSGASEGNAWALNQKPKCLCSAYEHHNIINNPKSVIIDENYLDMALTELNLRMQQDACLPYFGNYLFSHMLVNNETGEIFPVSRMTKKAHALGMLVHSDLTQALGNISVNVKDLGIDMATFTGHKIHAPKGIGFMYISEDVKEIKPLIYGGGQERGIRAGTENIPYIAGLRIAVNNAVVNRKYKEVVTSKLKQQLVNGLTEKKLPFIINSPGNSIASTLNISFKDIEGEALAMLLNDKEIYVGVGSACNTGDFEPSSVLTAMGVPDDYIRGAMRFSFDVTNTKEEINKVIEAIDQGYHELMD